MENSILEAISVDVEFVTDCRGGRSEERTRTTSSIVSVSENLKLELFNFS